MSERKAEYPELGDLIIATMETVTDYGAYAKLDDAFAAAEKPEDSEVRFYVMAAPRYSVEVAAANWKRAEEVLLKATDAVVKNVTKAGGSGSFKREK